jgi:hypothetical protein
VDEVVAIDFELMVLLLLAERFVLLEALLVERLDGDELVVRLLLPAAEGRFRFVFNWVEAFPRMVIFLRGVFESSALPVF